MTTNSTSAEDRLAEFLLRLPDAPMPFGAYVPAVHAGNLLFLSGMLATSVHGFAQFDDGKPADEAMHNTCFPCHKAAKARDFVFNRYAPRY